MSDSIRNDTKQEGDGGPAFACARCAQPAARRQGHQWLCAKHYRFGQMRALAKRRGLYVPTPAELEFSVLHGNECADCHRSMVWLSEESAVLVASLQHYRDGTFALVCRSCNTRHAYMPGDTYRDMPKDHKWCPQCNTAKQFSSYATDNGRSGPMKLKSWCKECSSAAHTNWQRNNREHYNQKQREYRAANRAPR